MIKLLLVLIFTISSFGIVYPQVSFEEVAIELGIVGSFGEKGFYSSGLSFIDFDKDGWDDLTFGTDFGEPVYIYKNNKSDFFEKVYLNISQTKFQKGVLWFDFDNDGDLDFINSNFAGVTIDLYKNNGNIGFENITVSSNVYFNDMNKLKNAISAADIDNDGFLDVFQTGFVSDNRLLYNNGNSTFTDIAASAGVKGNITPSFVHYFMDLNKDLYPDIYSAIDRDLFPNEMYVNNGDLTFTNVAQQTQTDLEIDAMNVGVGDINNDGEFDIYITNTPEGNVLLLNNGDGTFQDIALKANVIFNSFCWGGNFADFNNDGFQDLFVAGIGVDSMGINKVYLNNQDLTFSAIPDDRFSSTGTILNKSFSSAIGDYNNDGKVDIAVSNGNYENFQLWKNTSIDTNSYIDMVLEGVSSNRDAVGVTIEVYCDALHQYKYTTAGNSFQAQDSKKIHFGLANHQTVDSLILKWPSGIVDKIYNIDVNLTLRIKEGRPNKTICDNTINNFKVLDGILKDNTYKNHMIESTAVVLSDTTTVFKAQHSLILKSPFNVAFNGNFLGEIEKCYSIE